MAPHSVLNWKLPEVERILGQVGELFSSEEAKSEIAETFQERVSTKTICSRVRTLDPARKMRIPWVSKEIQEILRQVDNSSFTETDAATAICQNTGFRPSVLIIQKVRKMFPVVIVRNQRLEENVLQVEEGENQIWQYSMRRKGRATHMYLCNKCRFLQNKSKGPTGAGCFYHRINLFERTHDHHKDCVPMTSVQSKLLQVTREALHCVRDEGAKPDKDSQIPFWPHVNSSFRRRHRQFMLKNQGSESGRHLWIDDSVTRCIEQGEEELVPQRPRYINIERRRPRITGSPTAKRPAAKRAKVYEASPTLNETGEPFPVATMNETVEPFPMACQSTPAQLPIFVNPVNRTWQRRVSKLMDICLVDDAPVTQMTFARQFRMEDFTSIKITSTDNTFYRSVALLLTGDNENDDVDKICAFLSSCASWSEIAAKLEANLVFWDVDNKEAHVYSPTGYQQELGFPSLFFASSVVSETDCNGFINPIINACDV